MLNLFILDFPESTLMLHKNSEIDSLKLKQLFSKRQETASNLL